MKISEIRLSFVFLLFALSLVSCKKVDVKNGEIPEKYLPHARAYEGRYLGVFNDDPAFIEMVIKDNKPVVLYADVDGELIDSGCFSSIGQLKTLHLKKNSEGKGRLKSAEFYFNPGECSWVKGRRLILNFFEDQTGFKAHILKSEELPEGCHEFGRDPMDDDTRCHFVKTHFYTGEFHR